MISILGFLKIESNQILKQFEFDLIFSNQTKSNQIKLKYLIKSICINLNLIESNQIESNICRIKSNQIKYLIKSNQI